jgi:L-threonylcarbamoyladenylate synthase
LRTRVLKADEKGGAEVIKEAVNLLLAGEVVAFPTETVYGLGCNALDNKAVEKVFAAKGRPSDNPLIVHISNIEQIKPLVREIPDIALKLADKFWPGPLTMVFLSSGKAASSVTAGLDTIAVRMPAHAVALEIISKSAIPIAAPSANRSGRPSPTDASHVYEDLNGKIPLIIDAGKTDIGLESTVLDLTRSVPVILRPGGITAEMLNEVLGEVLIDESVLNAVDFDHAVASPGMKHTHYAPQAEMMVVSGESGAVVRKIKSMAEDFSLSGKRVGILATSETAAEYKEKFCVLTPGSRLEPHVYASSFFAKLREFDALSVDIILAEGLSTKDEGLAIMNRMLKAAGFNIVDAE